VDEGDLDAAVHHAGELLRVVAADEVRGSLNKDWAEESVQESVGYAREGVFDGWVVAS